MPQGLAHQLDSFVQQVNEHFDHQLNNAGAESDYLNLVNEIEEEEEAYLDLESNPSFISKQNQLRRAHQVSIDAK